MTGGETPRAELVKMQEKVNKLFTEIHDSGVTGRNVQEVLVALVRVMNELDIAVQRAGRI